MRKQYKALSIKPKPFKFFCPVWNTVHLRQTCRQYIGYIEENKAP